MTAPGKAVLIEIENLKCDVYLDSALLPTIGVGHLLTKGELSSGKIHCRGFIFDTRKGITEDQAIILMEDDLKPTEVAVLSLVTVPLTYCEMDALFLFVYNIGVDAFEHSTLLKKLNAANYDAVPTEMRRWVHAAGRVSNGLKNRREREIRVWGGSYDV